MCCGDANQADGADLQRWLPVCESAPGLGEEEAGKETALYPADLPLPAQGPRSSVSRLDQEERKK